MGPTKIVIVGGGFGGIYALKRFHELFHANKNIQITLVNEKNYFLFTPLLHEVATGGVNPQNTIEPIRKILGCCLHTLCLGKAIKVNLDNKVLETTTRNMAYDYLILAPGAETNFYNIPGARDYSFPLKSLPDAIRIKNHCITLIEQASHIDDRKKRRNILRFVVVGGGATGVELAAELQEFLKETFSRYYSKEIIDDISIVLVQRAQVLLPQFSKPLQTKSFEVLRKKGVEIRLGTSVTRVSKDEVVLNHNDVLGTQTVLWVIGIQPARILFTGSEEQKENERLKVNQYLQLEKYPEIYAIGDLALAESATGQPLPALAQVAVQEARAIADNINRQINKQVLKPFVYKHSGTLLSLGQWMAIGEISRFVLWGHLTWWIWRTIYLSKLISRQKKVKVAIDWTINIFSARDISLL